MPVTLNCSRCKQQFAVKPSHVSRSRYCSKACAYADKRTIPETICVRCGVTYRPFSGATAKYCSMDCYNAARREMPADERTALLAKATARIRGSQRSHDDLCKRARTKQERAKLSSDEAEIYAALISAGLQPIPLYALNKFNLDFGFPSQRVAVEYHGGNWHNTAKHQARDARKAEYLTEHGWTLLTFPQLAKARVNDFGNRRVALAKLVAAVVEAVHR